MNIINPKVFTKLSTSRGQFFFLENHSPLQSDAIAAELALDERWICRKSIQPNILHLHQSIQLNS